ncbi:tape measure protein [Acinetobacter pittii]|uniref:tape measure protein n=1 Tax=Acinetobacter pittii TaxID=48296 RepID=UPI001E5F516F|nr:tape measure protein [Acinetobacter pittii]MDP7845821.1 tape measure protein [Acinetobacter pittii]MDP7869913.1 tape measure protein [Acinetobacter pittii]UFN54605.1 tape measure protein [Acinetobacter pittii]
MAQESRLVIVIDAKNAERNARNLGNELDSIERKGDFATKSMDGLSVATRQLAGYMAGLVTVGAAVSKMDTYTGIQNQLKLVTDGQNQLNTAMDNTFEIAQRSRSSWESTATVYQKLAMNAKDVGLAQEDIGRLTETISKGIALSGATAAQADAAIMQLGQALGSGALRGDEFNSVMENGYGLMQLIAKGMNVPIGQLKSMAENGELTSEKVTKALLKMSDEADKQFGKTDATIGQSLGLLSNSLTQFIGEAGRSSGAAQVLSGSIEGLANNFELLADGAVVLGIGAITKAIISKTVAVQSDLVASAAQKVADQAQKQDALILATLKVNEAKAHLANVQATNAETQAKFGATAANARYKIASDAVTQAVIAQTAAQNALNTATSVGSKIFGLVGGWAGVLTIGVTALAAGYMYMQDRTEKANQKLKEQAEVANQAAEELRKLHGVEKQSAINDMTTALDAQNKALRDAAQAAGSALIDIQNYTLGNVEVTKISNEARLGTISYTEALHRLNGMNIPPDLYNALKKQIEGYDQAYFAGVKLVEGLKAVGIEAKLQGNAAQNAANQNIIHANSMDNVADAANNATNALSDYLKKLQQSTFKTELTNKLIGNYGFDPERAKAFAEAYVQNGNKISAQDAKIIDQNLAANRKLQASEEAVAQARRNSAAAARKSTSESKRAANEAKREATESARIAQENAQLAKQILYDYGSEFVKIESDLTKEIQDIQKASLSDKDKSNLINEAKSISLARKQVYLLEYQQDVDAWNWSEEQKLLKSYEIAKARVDATKGMTKEEREVRKQSLDAIYKDELAILQLAQEQQLFQIQQNYLHESDAIAKRYELERKKIEEIRDAKIRAGLLNASARAEDNEYEGRRRDAFQNYQAMSASMGGVQEYYNLDKELEDRRKTIDDALKWNNISEEEARQSNLAAEKDYLLKRAKLNSYYGEQITGSMVGMLEAAGDKQSGIYKAMFAANKAFAIAQSLISIQQGIAQAAANPFPYNLAAMATVAASTASIVANIQSVAGVFHGGKDYVPKEATYLLDKGERVVSPRQNQDLTSFLASQREMTQYNAINSNPTNGSATVLEPIVNVYVMEGQTADVTRNDDGSLDVRIRQIAGEVAEQVFLQGIQNPNSRISKAFKQNYNATPRRQ